MKTSTSRLMELAIKGLETERQRIDAEIDSLKQQMRSSGRGDRASASVSAGRAKSRRKIVISPEESKRRSERMKLYWAEYRKKKAAASKGRK